MTNTGKKIVCLAIGIAIAVAVNAEPTDLSKIKCQTDPAGAPVSCEFDSARIRLNVAGSYRAGFFNASAAEGVTYDRRTHRLFVANNIMQSLDVVDIRNPNDPRKEFSIDVSKIIVSGDKAIGIPESVAISEKRGLLAVIIAPGRDVTMRGKIAFYESNVRERHEPINPLKTLEVGFTPTMVTFTPDGHKLVVANEGEPTDFYDEDPPGLISIIDLSKGLEYSSVNNIGFEQFNDQKEELKSSGIRITGPTLLVPDPCETTTVARDLEPEHVAISADSRTAWVTLAENNALAIIDMSLGKISEILSFGLKDHNLPNNGLDATDVEQGIRRVDIRPWPIKGMYMPSQVAPYTVDDETYLVFGNEGTRRNYDAFGDEIRISSAVFDDQDAFSVELQRLRLKVSRVDSDKDCDGDLDELFSFGARSFSIRTVTGDLIFDSGDDFEQITALATREPCVDKDGKLDQRGCFNTPDDENSFDETSDLRGPEPISVATGKIDDHLYAFIGLERIGGIMVYDITDPYKPQFEQYINNRNFGVQPKLVCIEDEPETEECAMVGDLSAEDLVFISKHQSPIDEPLLVVSNETSGSVTMFRIDEIDEDDDEEDDTDDDED